MAWTDNSHWWRHALMVPIALLSGSLGTSSLGLSEAYLVPGFSRAAIGQAPPANPNLEVGIIQRFGRDPQDQLTLAAPSGSSLTLRFTDEQGETRQANVAQVTVGIYKSALMAPEQISRLVLSSHRSFESAEADAQWWQGLGLETEVVQPEEWQVWAARGRYTLPQQAQILDFAEAEQRPARLDTFERDAIPKLTWQVDGQTYRGDRLAISSNGDRTLVNDRPYAGELWLQPNAHESFTLVNSVPIETYLRGVVPHEIGYQAPRAAVEAQTILARTYALQNRHRFRADDYEICATTHCQVYQGLSDTAPMADQAIARTRGQVLTYQGQLADAVYSSTTGGITAAFEHVWDGEPRSYLQAVPDTLPLRAQIEALDLSLDSDFRRFLALRDGFNEVGLSRYFRWELPKTLAELTESLRENQRFLTLPIPEFESIVGLRVLERASGGRVQSLEVQLQEPNGQITPLVLSKDLILLGLRAPFSLLFTLDPIRDGDTITGYNFIGGGLGHGVGMSQIGAYNLARLGFEAPQILDFYYGGTTLVPLTEQLASRAN